jgi:hypothetical protein
MVIRNPLSCCLATVNIRCSNHVLRIVLWCRSKIAKTIGQKRVHERMATGQATHADDDDTAACNAGDQSRSTSRGDQEQSRRSDKTGLRGRVTLWTRRHVSGLEASVAGTRGREKPRRRDAGRISATTCRYAWAVPIPGCDTVLGHPAPATLLFVPKPCAGFSCKPIYSWLAQQTVSGCMPTCFG